MEKNMQVASTTSSFLHVRNTRRYISEYTQKTKKPAETRVNILAEILTSHLQNREQEEKLVYKAVRCVQICHQNNNIDPTTV